MSKVYIETSRLLLRGWQKSDLEPFARMNADQQVMRYFPEPYSQEKTRQFFATIQQEFADYGYGLYAAEEKITGLLIGYIGFHRAAFDMEFCPCIEIGWRLNKTFWNKGYATEGAKACLEYGFSHLGFEKVYSFTAVVNRPSERVMQKIGMSLECYFEHPNVPEDHPLRPHLLYAVTSK